MENSEEGNAAASAADERKRFHAILIVLLVAAAVYAGCMISPRDIMAGAHISAWFSTATP